MMPLWTLDREKLASWLKPSVKFITGLVSRVWSCFLWVLKAFQRALSHTGLQHTCLFLWDTDNRPTVNLWVIRDLDNCASYLLLLSSNYSALQSEERHQPHGDWWTAEPWHHPSYPHFWMSGHWPWPPDKQLYWLTQDKTWSEKYKKMAAR